LERLIYTYLGDWIRTQEHGFKEGIDGAESRLMAAKNLKDSLEAILKGDAITGKSGLDIFALETVTRTAYGLEPGLK
jgi:hypothetical protein